MAQLAAHYSRVDGVRKPATPLLPGNTLAIFLPLTGVLCVVLLAILADQSDDQ
ncbi:ABC transporter permease [Escherichia coli]|uniref:ABC transporter permease n=1 Tax=Escherichia coli TaxID=562 RepID=A0A377CI03_ECOLX|nr:ABC transporter permease [Escherichia coli]